MSQYNNINLYVKIYILLNQVEKCDEINYTYAIRNFIKREQKKNISILKNEE